MQDVFRFHNTNTNTEMDEFDILLYSLGHENDNSPEVTKIAGTGTTTNNSSNSWKVLMGTVPEMAELLLDDQIDILIDLCGYTGTSLVAELLAYLRIHQLGSLFLQQQQRGVNVNNNNRRQLDNNDDNDNVDKDDAGIPPMMIHVSYMGFPGSSGSPYIDYMIADTTVIPPTTSSIRKCYTEHILFMPHCYFVNSHKYIMNTDTSTNHESYDDHSHDHDHATLTDIERTIMDSDSPSRGPGCVCLRKQMYGLPTQGEGFVFCCHSRPDKIDPFTFRTWIKALKRTRQEGRKLHRKDMANAVLWMLRSSSDSTSNRGRDDEKDNSIVNNDNNIAQCRMERNLIQHAQAIMNEREEGDDNSIKENDYCVDYEGDGSSYLVFCDKVPRDEHLKRLSIGADLFLDTPAYNAHTVGCDCLSSGVPMISLLRKDDENDNRNGDCDTNNNDNADIDGDCFGFVRTEKLASRVGASLLKNAIVSTPSLSSSALSSALTVSSMNEYEDTMVQCARENSCNNDRSINDRGRYKYFDDNFPSFRRQLLENLDVAPLWDTKRWVRNLEAGLSEMVRIRDTRDSHVDIYVMDNDE